MRSQSRELMREQRGMWCQISEFAGDESVRERNIVETLSRCHDLISGDQVLR